MTTTMTTEKDHQLPEQLYLIWSEEHGAWWKRESGGQTWGYTHSMEQAGRYTKERAAQIVAKANAVVHRDTGFYPDRSFNEIAITDPLQKTSHQES